MGCGTVCERIDYTGSMRQLERVCAPVESDAPLCVCMVCLGHL